MAELAGRRILLVEDEFMLAQELCNQLEEAGAVVIGPEPSVDRALARIAQEPEIDFAILDVNLGGDLVFPVADALKARGAPFVFSTGYEDELISERYPGVVKCDKPVELRDLLPALKSLIRPS